MKPVIHTHRYESGNLEIYVPHQLVPQFKELVHRATNLWPDASPEIKAFADMVTNDGKLMQDYSKVTVTHQPKTS